MQKHYILAHDLGTTGDKAVLIDPERGILGSTFSGYPTYYPEATWAEQDPLAWWCAFCETNQKLFSQVKVAPQEVAVVTFSGQMMGCLPLDEHGQPLRRAIIWADQRATSEAMRLLEAVGLEAAYQITGHRISPAYSVAKIMWLAANEPTIYKKASTFLQAKDFIVQELTGKRGTDFSDACGTGLFDIKEKCWSEKMVQAAGIAPEKLPQAFPSVHVIGEVMDGAAKESGLSPGTPVVIGGGDGVCATAGAGVVKEGVGHIYLGSSAWVAVASSSPLLDPKLRTFTWIHLDPSLYSPNGTMHNAGSSLEWAKESLGALEVKVAEWVGLSAYDILERAAQGGPLGAEGRLFLPYLMGERSPHWNPNARGVFLGITRKHSRAHLFRAVFEGVSFNLRIILLALRELGADVNELRLIGGGARSGLWVRILADVLSLPLEITAAPLEATALGAAMAGAVGVGLVSDFPTAAEKFIGLGCTVSPEPEASRVYDSLYEVFLRAYKALIPVFDLLVERQCKGGSCGGA